MEPPGGKRMLAAVNANSVLRGVKEKKGREDVIEVKGTKS